VFVLVGVGVSVSVEVTVGVNVRVGVDVENNWNCPQADRITQSMDAIMHFFMVTSHMNHQ